MKSKANVLEFTATPTGICEAARAGDVAAIDLILAARPELLAIDNPHSWTKTVNGHERGLRNDDEVVCRTGFLTRMIHGSDFQ